MNELERSIAAYAQFLDEQSLARSPVHMSELESYEGELIVVDIQTRESNETSTGEPPWKTGEGAQVLIERLNSQEWEQYTWKCDNGHADASPLRECVRVQFLLGLCFLL